VKKNAMKKLYFTLQKRYKLRR